MIPVCFSVAFIKKEEENKDIINTVPSEETYSIVKSALLSLLSLNFKKKTIKL